MSDNHTTLIHKAYQYRGLILENCIILEKSIEKYISDSITIDEIAGYKITVYLIDRLSFDSKISVFQSILKNSLDSIEYKKKYSKLLGKIRKIKDERNYFAHYLTSYSQQDIEKVHEGLTLVNYRDSINKKTYDDASVTLLLNEIIDTTTLINELIDKIPPSGPPSE